MLKLFALLAAVSLAPPPEDLAREVRAAIWSDLEMNALIGNGNWVGSLWYNASSDNADAPDLHIQDLSCRPRARGHQCAFVLFRDGGVVKVLGEDAPARLRCDAIFERQDGEEGLGIRHHPPHGEGHSRTTMKCHPVQA
jgi:hypothetical protein